MAKNTITVRVEDELEKAIGNAVKKKKFKNKTEAVVTPLKKFYKIKK